MVTLASILTPFRAGPWDGKWFYSKTVQQYTGAATPFEQMGLVASAYGVIHGVRSVMQSVYITKAANSPIGSEDRLMYSYLGKGGQLNKIML